MQVSVIIPTYNEEKSIGKCLESLANQTIKPDEVIVVDNNCTDKTVAIAQKFKARIIKEKKQGMIYARNAGFNNAKYEILARTDADAILPRDWISRIKEDLKDDSIGAVSGPAYYFALPKPFRILEFVNKTFFRINKRIMNLNLLFGPNMALRKSAWTKVSKDICLKDKDVHEDFDLALHLSRYTKIKFDYDLLIKTSFRRWLRLKTYFKYSSTYFNMLRSHKNYFSS